MPLAGGEAEPLTDAPEGVRSFKFSPKGDRLAYTTSAPVDPQAKKRKEKGFDAKDVGKNHRHTLLMVLDLTTEDKPVQVTPIDRTAVDFEWSPDGKELAVLVAPSPGSDDTMMRLELTRFPAGGGNGITLADKMGKMTHLRWSPNGKTIAWLGAGKPNDGTNGTVWLVPAKGGTPTAVNAGAEETAYGLEWDRDKLLVSAVTGTHSHLSRRTASGKQEMLIENGPVFLGFSVDKKRKHIALSGNTSKHPSEVFSGRLGGTLERRTHHNVWLKDVDLGVQSSIEWTAMDGTVIGGVLIRPVGGKGGAPLVCYVHGGPEWQDLDGWTTRYLGAAQVLAGKGYAVLMPNYRGSAGRGTAFAAGDHNDLGGKEFDDILAGIENLSKAGTIDKNRVGMIGASYGGFMSALAATKGSPHFKAAINLAGIANWLSFTGTSDIPYEMSEVHWNQWCYDKPAACRKGSPLTYLDRANTPLMVVHGEQDKRVPIGQAWELYTAFKVRNLPVELVLYPRAGHGLHERNHQIDFMNRTIAWFDRYLKAGSS
ncbi:MAG: dipeptidyl aminopeptidase/acylaminoacyl peptidase [Myxococcota bacterium]